MQLANDYFAQAVIVTKGIEEREIVRVRLQKARDTEFASLNTRIYPLELGPPVGCPLQYRVSGQTPDGTRDAAFLVAQTIGQNPNTRLINFDWNEPMKSFRVQVDQDQVRQLGVSSKSLAEALNAITSGMIVTQVRDFIYLTDLVARAREQQRASLQTLRNLQVALDTGQTIPLSQVATIQYELEPPVVWRRNLLPTITVQADVLPGIEAKTVRWDVDRVRCSDLLGANEDDRAAAAMFYYGYLAAKAGIHIIDTGQIDGNLHKVMDQCAAAPSMTVPEAFREALGRRT